MNVDDLLRKAGVKIDSTSPIDYGKQHRVSRGPDKAIVNVYLGKKGTKVVVQMNTPLAEELRGLFGGAKEAVAQLPVYAVWCGSDESGKGDYFGPLAVAAVGLTTATAEKAAGWHVRDCKTMSDATALDLDRRIREALPHKVVGWMPEEYNRRYPVARSVNVLLGEAHAEAIAGVAAKLPGLEAAVVDQFGDEGHVERALRARGVDVPLVQRPKADETDLAASAASVLARAAFLRGLEKLVKAWGLPFHKGAGPEVLAHARDFVRKHGQDQLGQVAKLHFKSTQQL